ncbi:spermatogenesis-associated protein 4 isoform X2 [Podarcis raffonei]|uniref:spermatogenesis-associated protein 4 isoform X2 n=1 Tax=Podarcis raffonei TaxID=65483 RepID=UPI0023296D11|nr:spermatogenesis-associated protein 4 isoform X2 [Podarcis raffonei]
MVLEGARKGKLPLLMSYSTSPRRAGLPRTVLRWLQSLDLSFSPTHFQDIQMRSFENGTSLPVKLSNWSQLGKFFAKRNLHPIRELIDGTIHCKPGAAEIFLQDIYTMLTNRRIKHIQDEEIDFTDSNYQDKLPMVARSTASRAIKTNIKLTEIMVEPNIQKNRKKVNAIINMHMQRRQLEREQVPERFGIKKTLGERAIRRPSMIVPSVSTVKIQKEKSIPVPSVASTEIRGKTGVHFKTVQVKQAEMPFRCELNSGTLNHLKEL